MNEVVQQRWQEFEKLGEEKVRQNLATHVYGEDNTKLAREWLSHKAQQKSEEAQRRSEASSAEEVSIARSAKDAAWESAEAAKMSAKEAMRANTRASLSIVVSAVAAFAAIAAVVIVAATPPKLSVSLHHYRRTRLRSDPARRRTG